jgi:hypothetical protein
MITVELFTREGCSLCEEAHVVLKRVRADHPFHLTITYIRPGEPLFDQYTESVPVVHVNGSFHCKFKVDEESFRSKLTSLTP